MKFREVVEVGSTIVITVVALVVGTAYLSDRGTSVSVHDFESQPRIADWEESNSAGVRLGASDVPFVLTEFVDFQCPFCSQLAPRLEGLLAEYPEDLAVVFQHFPLGMHQQATPAAIAVECAGRQGRFWEMYRVLFASQDNLGRGEWVAFAKEAGVADLTGFEQCADLPADSFPRIEYGRSLGERAGVNATPTVWLNGRVVNPNLETVREVLRTGKWP